jgi:hypothetical protein
MLLIGPNLFIIWSTYLIFNIQYFGWNLRPHIPFHSNLAESSLLRRAEAERACSSEAARSQFLASIGASWGCPSPVVPDDHDRV